jgi:hypothetical protein
MSVQGVVVAISRFPPSFMTGTGVVTTETAKSTKARREARANMVKTVEDEE